MEASPLKGTAYCRLVQNLAKPGSSAFVKMSPASGNWPMRAPLYASLVLQTRKNPAGPGNGTPVKILPLLENWPMYARPDISSMVRVSRSGRAPNAVTWQRCAAVMPPPRPPSHWPSSLRRSISCIGVDRRAAGHRCRACFAAA
jgi:hypothetical protein